MVRKFGFIDLDLDWAGSADDRRSATWICFNLSFAMMSWACRKQKSVAISITKVKYIAACDACTEAMWLHKLVSGPSDHVLNLTMIHCNDQSYVKLSEKMVFHDRSKYIEIKHYILRDKV